MLDDEIVWGRRDKNFPGKVFFYTDNIFSPKLSVWQIRSLGIITPSYLDHGRYVDRDLDQVEILATSKGANLIVPGDGAYRVYIFDETKTACINEVSLINKVNRIKI